MWMHISCRSEIVFYLYYLNISTQIVNWRKTISVAMIFGFFKLWPLCCPITINICKIFNLDNLRSKLKYNLTLRFKVKTMILKHEAAEIHYQMLSSWLPVFNWLQYLRGVDCYRFSDRGAWAKVYFWSLMKYFVYILTQVPLKHCAKVDD